MSRRRKKTEFEISLRENQQAYWRYWNQLAELAMGCFRYTGLPNMVESRTIENALCRAGKAVYFDDEVMGNLCLEFSDGGRFDVNGYPILRRAYSYYNNYTRLLKPSNSVVIYNNLTRTNTWYAISQFARRLYVYDRIADINVNAQKTPVALVANENERLTVLNAYKEFDGNAPVIHLTDNFNLNSIQVLKTDAPFVADKIWYQKQQIYNEALTFLGIRNVNQSKKERMVTAEVDIANIDANYNRTVKLECRQRAIEKINKMFGTNIVVEFIGDELVAQVLEGEQMGRVSG